MIEGSGVAPPESPTRPRLARAAWLAGAVFLTLPTLAFKTQGLEASAPVEAVVFGLGILGAAFLLSWAAEVAQMEISQALALAILALIAILPEYAVDLYFAWRAAEDPIYGHYAAANMTGANRLLVGLGWPVIVWLFWIRWRQTGIRLVAADMVAVRFLGVATVYAFAISVVGKFWWLDTVVLVGLFGWYLARTASLGHVEPELVGPSALIAELRRGPRVATNVALFVFSGLVIFVSAEPFAESLIQTGEHFGIDEFLLVQWIAPLASEAPEFIIAALWTIRGHATMALSALISSKVNQWTLLIGTISLVYSISAGQVAALELDVQQQHEIFLTAAQSIFAVVMLADRTLNWWQALLLFIPFATQLAIPGLRMEVAYVYLVLTAIWGFRYRHHLVAMIRGRRGVGPTGSGS
ncbi:MAG TPA: sodium:calcium antiporter [Gemmatimonadota bacterium]|nr:sodium:calcium antiporter [Gemmatimonadota bacterium]